MKQEILVAFSGGGPPSLGNIWRITAKNTDFYVDPVGGVEMFHLSVHGPNDSNRDGHRFHIGRKAVATVHQRGGFMIHSIPRNGYAFDGQELAPGVFRIARIRWVWDLPRPRFQQAASYGPLPEITDHRSGVVLSKPIQPNGAADLDMIASYKRPYWPHAADSLRDNSRLAPLRNDAGMWLTATSYKRSQTATPTPPALVLSAPQPDEEPARIMCAGPGGENGAGLYWFVEAITSRQLLEASRPTAPAQRQSRSTAIRPDRQGPGRSADSSASCAGRSAPAAAPVGRAERAQCGCLIPCPATGGCGPSLGSPHGRT